MADYHVEPEVHLLDFGILLHSDIDVLVVVGRQPADAPHSYAMGVRPAVGSSAYGALALLHDDFDQPDRLHPFRHHGGSRTCNSCMYRCAYLWRGILVALGHRHPTHPGRCGSHHSKKKEILKKGKCSDTT